MLTLTRRLPANAEAVVCFTLSLTAEERTRSRHHFTIKGHSFYLNLPRGTVLHHGDLLQADTQTDLVRVTAKLEPVMTVLAETPLSLLRAAYHLGNRHVPLEVTAACLRFSPDAVLQAMLEQLGLQVQEEVAPFQPEAGAYDHPYQADHSHVQPYH